MPDNLSALAAKLSGHMRQSTGIWTAYTPTVTALTGTLTTVSASGIYFQLGKTVFIDIAVTITTNGTGAGAIVVTLPTSQTGVSIVCGRENAVTGKMLQGRITGANLYLFFYDGTYPGGDGRVLYVSGYYRQP